MSLGQTIGLAQALSDYRSMNSKLIGEAFSDLLEVSKSNSNILADLQGGVGSKKPFILKQDLAKGAKDRVNFPVASSLGQKGRMGTEQAIGYEETLIQGSWSVRIDNKRVVVGWSDIVAQVATTGKDWKEVYAEMVGTRMGQIEQEDMLMMMMKRRERRNIVRPNTAASNSALRTADVMDTHTITRAAGLLKSFGAEPAMVGKSARTKRPIQKYVLFGADAFLRPIKSEAAYLTAVAQGDLRGDGNAQFDGDFQTWDGHLIKCWDIVDHDNPGPIGSTILPKAILGDPITTATTAFNLFGGGRTQASLGDQAGLYAPFCFFPGYAYMNYQEEEITPDAGTHYFVVFDPADGFWCVYSYTGSANTGQQITITNRLAGSSSGAAVSTLANWAWDSAQNKTAFPTGSFIFPVNDHLVPFGYGFMWGADVGGKAYGAYMNRRIMNKTDYDNLIGFGIQSIYGVDVRLDTLGFPRGYVVIEAAVQS